MLSKISFPQKEKERIKEKEKEFFNNQSNNLQSRLEIEKKVSELRLRLKIDASNENFFYLVAYKLPLNTLIRLADTAKEVGRNPGALFNHLAQKEMRVLTNKS